MSVLSDVCPRNRLSISGCLRPGCKGEMMHLIVACSIMGGVIHVADSPSTTLGALEGSKSNCHNRY